MQIRIWELANDHGIDPQELRRLLAANGYPRPSVASLVPRDPASAIILRSRQRRAERQRASDVLNEAAEMFGVDRGELRPHRQPQPRNRRDPNSTGGAPTAWDRELFEPEEAQLWRDAGVYEARLASKARQGGLNPDDMLIKLDGVSIGQRLAGESIASIKSRLRERGQTAS
jgi:hypothetical protein